MRKVNIIIIYAFVFLIVMYIAYNESKKEKIVYVDNMELFSKFQMKIELENKFKAVESFRKTILDSLYNEIRIKLEINKDEEQESIKLLKKEFLIKKELFEKENSETQSLYNDQIWNQLNEYTKQYGDEMNYDFIIGANGKGELMYAKSSKNITSELLNFVNKKFNGK